MIVAPFYATYFVLRSVIDATTIKPVTSLNLVGSFATFCASFYFLIRSQLPASLAAAVAVAMAVMVLGSLTMVAMMRLYGARGFFDVATLRVALVNCALAGCLLGARYGLGLQAEACLAVEGFAVLIFAITLLVARRQWALSLLQHFGFGDSIKRIAAAKEFLGGLFRRLGQSAE